METIVALGSGKGSTIKFFCQKIQKEKPNFKITALITENPQSGLLKTAKKFNLPCHVIRYDKQNFTAWDQKLCDTLILYKPSLILLAGFLKKIGPIVLNQFPNQII
ncbi:MAG: formyltransferase family protein, partial [Oligoflexia bacterium]|nr:formyltransferase family protein [Oligoflexia bacterium]